MLDDERSAPVGPGQGDDNPVCGNLLAASPPNAAPRRAIQ